MIKDKLKKIEAKVKLGMPLSKEEKSFYFLSLKNFTRKEVYNNDTLL